MSFDETDRQQREWDERGRRAHAGADQSYLDLGERVNWKQVQEAALLAGLNSSTTW